jgi:hypothetical protein
MRSSIVVACGAVAVGVAGCGSGGQTAASVAVPAGPIAVSALIGPGRVAVSPDRLGAGPIVLTITNQASRAEALVVMTAASSRVLAHTAPINPQGSTQLNVDLGRGTYELVVAVSRARTDAQRSRETTAPGTTLHVGAARRGGGSALLTP